MSTIQMRETILQRSGVLQKRSRLARWALFFTSVSIVLIMIFSCVCSDIYYQTQLYSLLTLSLFGLTSLTCIAWLALLFWTIEKNFSSDLDRERKYLLICQSVFVISFTIRLVLIIWVSENDWVDFTRDYPNKMHVTSMLSLQFIIYNIVPYTTLIYLHYRNLRPQQRDNSVLL